MESDHMKLRRGHVKLMTFSKCGSVSMHIDNWEFLLSGGLLHFFIPLSGKGRSVDKCTFLPLLRLAYSLAYPAS